MPAAREVARRSRPAARLATAASARYLRERRVGVRRRGGAAQDDRVAGLQAQRGRVDRHVRPRLVDDRDDAERHAHPAHVQSVRQAMPVDHLADRVGERRDLPHRPRPSLRRATRPGAGGRAAPRPIAGLARQLHVALVRREDLVHARDQRRGDRLERGVLDGGVGLRERARRALGVSADVRDR